MRVSLLLQREPFGSILEKTLSRFWQEIYGQPFQVQWELGRPDLRQLRKNGAQAWLCNAFLNAIFVPEAKPEIFDPVRREFSHSMVRWRQPLQSAYVSLAANGIAAKSLAHGGLSVFPAVEQAPDQLLVAGNHKMRLLDGRAGKAYAILKSGFDDEFLRRELSGRRAASSLGLPVPDLQDLSENCWWFSENYVSGTPINRLSDAQEALDVAFSATSQLLRLLTHTAQEESPEEYAIGLNERIKQLVEANHLLSEDQKTELRANLAALMQELQAISKGQKLTTAQGHGDFQAANILVNDDGFWLIDWEYSARRQVPYDALVMALGARSSRDLVARLHQFVEVGWPDSVMARLDWPGFDWQNKESRHQAALLFLLEELTMHLQENANPVFVCPGEGLLNVLQEISRWQREFSFGRAN